MKVECIESKALTLTRGKVYEIKDGAIINDAGLPLIFNHKENKRGVKEFNKAQWDDAAIPFAKLKYVSR